MDGVQHVAAVMPRSGASPALGWANRAASAVLVVVLLVLAVGVGLRASGTTPLVERSGSMAPAIETGDLVLVREVAAGALARGDVASLEDPVSGRLLTHRVASVERTGGRVAVVTRGDANAGAERWVLPADAAVLRMAARVPAAGQPLIWLASPLPRMALAALGAALLAAALLRRIWSDR